MTDPTARLVAVLAVLLAGAALFVSISAANAPVDLATYSPKFPAGVDISSSAATPGMLLQAESTGVPLIRAVNAAGTEVWKFTDTGVFIGPAAGGTPTP